MVVIKMGRKKHNRDKVQRKLRRVQAKAERIQKELAARIEKQKAFTETVPRPENPGDRCWKCGDVVVFRQTKRKPKPNQEYAYRGTLWCDGCKTQYLCEQYKYWLTAAPVPYVPLNRACDVAMDSDRTGELSFAQRIQSSSPKIDRTKPRLIKATPTLRGAI